TSIVEFYNAGGSGVKAGRWRLQSAATVRSADAFSDYLRRERGGRGDVVELGRLRLAQGGPRRPLAGTLRNFHHVAEPTEDLPGLLGLTHAVLGQGQEGQVGRLFLFVLVVRPLEGYQRLGHQIAAVLGHA